MTSQFSVIARLTFVSRSDLKNLGYGIASHPSGATHDVAIARSFPYEWRPAPWATRND